MRRVTLEKERRHKMVVVVTEACLIRWSTQSNFSGKAGVPYLTVCIEGDDARVNHKVKY